MSQSCPADEHSLAMIFATHRRSFLNVAERITGSRSHAEDIVHDAFVKLISMPVSETIQSQSGYLMRIVRNLAIDHYRRKSMELHLMANEEEGYSVMAPEAGSPEVISRDRETLKTLDAALAQLPERTRYAFEMHRIHGFSQKDIAESLGVSPTLVNFMIRDALVHCRASLEGRQPAE